MLVVAARNDPRVPLSESDQIAHALKQHGTPVWLLMAKNEGHRYQKKANQEFDFYASVLFQQGYLLK
jgi:dipeptidyl aminopeptidase/acylaminoacyl peptidase